jgi:hypothetical protein
MPLPLLLWGAAAALGGYGVKKGFDANEMNKKAERIGKRAERNYQRAVEVLEAEKEHTNRILEDLGKTKAQVFSQQIKHLVDVVRKHKAANSRLKDFNEAFSETVLLQIENEIETSLELSSGLGKGAVAGALAAWGAYSGVGMLAAASTGTAISSLSGVAATNATLAWLGGGSLATGGMGIAGGTAVLGGVVLGPALAVGGFIMASKAEETLTQAREYEAETEIAVAKLERSQVMLQLIQTNAQELNDAIVKMAQIYDSVKVNDNSNAQKFEKMIAVGLNLKKILEVSILSQNGEPVEHLKQTISGYLEY